MATKDIFPKRHGWRGLFLALAVMLLAGCGATPYTGRKQILMVSPEREQALGYQAFSQIRGKSQPSQDQALQNRVRQVGERIAIAANRPDYKWEFLVFADDKNANAFCLPGGKVGIYTGLFKYIKSDDDLATVISHEAAHALARHAGERMSQARLAQAGGVALGVGLAALGAGSGATRLATQGYSLGTQVGVLLPYSRLQESEADRIGLILMAKAGYDPEAGIHFWERFASGKKDQAQGPQFLSTHPSDAARIQTMKKYLDEARQYYKKAGGGNSPKTGGQWSQHQNRTQGQGY